MKQTSVEHIGRSQLIPGVRPTVREQHEEAAPGMSTARGLSARTERLRRPGGKSLLAGFNASTRGRVRVSDRLVPRPTGGPVRLACVPAQVSGRGDKPVVGARRRSFAGLINLSGAPCHALPGRVGEERSVNPDLLT